MEITFKNEKLRLVKAKYILGDNIAIKAYDVDEMPYASVTAWVPGLASDEVAIKNYSENDGFLQVLINENIVEKPHRYVKSGFVSLPICRLKSWS